MKEVGIRSLGSFVPERRLTNEDLSKMVETSDEWIVTRTGISERRIAGDEWKTSDLSIQAARRAMVGSNLKEEEIDFVISSSCSPEVTCPAQAALVSKALGLKGYLFDVNAACSGLVYALALGDTLLKSGNGRHGLITAGEKITASVDYTDRTSCILFGDGAAALVLTTEPPYHRILGYKLGADPSGADLVWLGGQENHGTQDKHYFYQDGRGVFRFAVTTLKTLIPLMMEEAGVRPNDRYFIIPHQANLRMIENVAKEMGIPMERFVMNIQTRGNTSSASIGIAMAEAAEEGRFRAGDKLILVGFGGGLTWAAAALEW